jgi:type VI secretion system secreted protein Hcp
MAMNIYANIKLNGTDVTGDVSVSAVGGITVSQDHIEVHGFHHDLSIVQSPESHRASSNRVQAPIVFTKRIDRSSPQLFQAWLQNQQVDAVFKFFRMDPQTRRPGLFHVIEAGRGRLVGVRTEVLNNLTPDGGPMPELERITVVYHSIVVRSIPGATEVEIPWTAVSRWRRGRTVPAGARATGSADGCSWARPLVGWPGRLRPRPGQRRRRFLRPVACRRQSTLRPPSERAGWIVTPSMPVWPRIPAAGIALRAEPRSSSTPTVSGPTNPVGADTASRSPRCGKGFLRKPCAVSSDPRWRKSSARPSRRCCVGRLPHWGGVSSGP